MMKRMFLLGATFAIALPALAEVSVKNAWVRSTVAGQSTTGAFMQISDPAGGRLVEVCTGAAGVAELHEMTMDGTTMRMRAVPAIELAPGKTVELKPGGYHVMLMDLKEPLSAGESVVLMLVVEGKDKKRETVEVKATVRAPGSSAKH